jgi:ribosomal protein S18 acetylase RimI-like enzyme
MPAVREAHAGDAAELAAILSRAFADDPISLAIFPGPASRPQRLRRFFAFQLLHNYLPRGEVFTTEDRRAAALWLSPHVLLQRPVDRLAGLELAALLGRRYLWTRRLAVFLGEHHPRVPHYYLGILGTDPEYQRSGHASALLEPMLARCDAEQTRAYLECSREENLAFYARFGFDVREEVQPDARSPRLWLMERPPARLS